MGDIGSAIDEALRGLGSHPRLEDLRAHQEGRLTRAESERIEAHIGGCPSCAEWAGDLKAFLRPPREPAQGELAVDAAQIWRNVARALGRSQPEEPAEESAASLSLVRRFREIILLQPLAAGLLVTTVLASGAWLAARRQADRLEGGEINVPILAIDKGLRRQAEPGPDQPPLEVPPGAVLIFTPPIEPQPIGHEVRISILDGRPGRLVWSEQGLRPTSKGSFHLRLPHDLRPGETYRLQIVPGEGQELTIRVMASRRE